MKVLRTQQHSSRTGENVLNLFGGSRSTLIAAQQTGRRAFLMQLDALYCDVIVQQYEQFTGVKAERVSTLTVAERTKLSDPAHEGVGLQPERDGRVRCSAWLGGVIWIINKRRRVF